MSACVLYLKNVPISPSKHEQNKEVLTKGHKCRSCQVIGNAETGLLQWFVVWTP